MAVVPRALRWLLRAVPAAAVVGVGWLLFRGRLHGVADPSWDEVLGAGLRRCWSPAWRSPGYGERCASEPGGRRGSGTTSSWEDRWSPPHIWWWGWPVRASIRWSIS